LWCLVAAGHGNGGRVLATGGAAADVGVAESTLFPAGLAWLAKNVEERQRGLAAGIFVSGSKWGRPSRPWQPG